MKIQITLLTLLLSAVRILAADLPQNRAVDEYQTSVLGQFRRSDLVAKYDSAEIVTAQMISWATVDDSIEEKYIRPKSEKCVLSVVQRQILRSVLTDDTHYAESRKNCRCIFEPLLRVSFVTKTEGERCDIFFAGYGHGELKAFQDGTKVARARTRVFLPRLLTFLDQTFPKHKLAKALHRDFRRRSKAEETNKPLQGMEGKVPSSSTESEARRP